MTTDVSSDTAALHAQRTGSVDAGMIALMRCVLAFAGLAFIYIDPTQSHGLGAPAFSALVGYCVWATALLYWTSRGPKPAAPPRFAHWGDVLFCAYLVTLTEGINSVFFSFFLFSILVASFARGFREGAWVTVASVVLFTLVGLRLSPQAVFTLDPSLIRPVYLLTLGYMIAFWGGLEVAQRRRLRLLHDINQRWNPRLGYDHALGVHLESMLEFFDAGSCLLVLRRATEPPLWLSYHAARGRPGQATIPKPIDASTGQAMLVLPPDQVVLHDEAPAWPRRGLALLRRLGSTRGDRHALGQTLSTLGNLLDAPSYLSVPFAQRDGSVGRVFLTPGEDGFSEADAAFAAQVATAISRVVESVQLIDELVARAADHERYRISLDIHDATIQPYVGLKLGLDALARRASADNPLAQDIGELRDMADATIGDLRRYTATLRDDMPLAGDSLLLAIGQQAGQFQRYYGITVSVQHDEHLLFSARLGNALLHILAEGLSNIRRHTQAKWAHIGLRRQDNMLQLELTNGRGEGAQTPAPDFTPASISQRAHSLGGSCEVLQDSQGYTVVRVLIPL
jgi:signal transduction histidine kinase